MPRFVECRSPSVSDLLLLLAHLDRFCILRLEAVATSDSTYSTRQAVFAGALFSPTQSWRRAGQVHPLHWLCFLASIGVVVKPVRAVRVKAKSLRNCVPCNLDFIKSSQARNHCASSHSLPSRGQKHNHVTLSEERRCHSPRGTFNQLMGCGQT